jgi:tol-pal system protein YbgF
MLRFLVIFCFLFSGLALADEAPVEDLSSDQQVLRLQQRLDNLEQSKLGEKIAKLEVKLQHLQGAVEVLQHDIQKVGQHVVVPSPVAINATITPVEEKLDERAAYKAAYQLVLDNNYGAAATALQDYLKQFATGTHAANAHYWLGELYSLADEKIKARGEFNAIVKYFPGSNKVGDALLKLGVLHKKAKQTKLARNYFDQVIKRYPDTTSAKLAQDYLKALR